LDTQSLKVFLSVADNRSFTKAAEQLYMTQPAVSKRIQSLESNLGHTLFHRVGHNIQLTAVGQLLVGEAKAILQQIEWATQRLKTVDDEPSGPLQIATGHHIGLHRLPSIWTALTLQYPKIDCHIQFMDSEQAYQGVLDGDIECAVLTLPDTPHSLCQAYTIWNDELGIFCSTGHPLAERNNISVEDLSKYPVILPEKHTFTRQKIAEYFAQHNLDLPRQKTGDYLETIKTLVECGFGWSVLPKSLQNEKLKPLLSKEFQLSRPLGLIHHRKRPLSKAGQVFLHYLMESKEK